MHSSVSKCVEKTAKNPFISVPRNDYLDEDMPDDEGIPDIPDNEGIPDFPEEDTPACGARNTKNELSLLRMRRSLRLLFSPGRDYPNRKPLTHGSTMTRHVTCRIAEPAPPKRMPWPRPGWTRPAGMPTWNGLHLSAVLERYLGKGMRQGPRAIGR
jgi:hypothetical protein